MGRVEDVASAIRSYGVVPSHYGLQRWYVYRRSEVVGGCLIPNSSMVFFNRDKAYRACDGLNAKALIEMLGLVLTNGDRS